MKLRFSIRRLSVRASFFTLGAFLALMALSSLAFAQEKLSKRYAAGKNVRIELRNISGTIVVESWNKDEIRLSATIEAKGTHVTPKQINDSLVVDVMSENRGKGDVGDRGSAIGVAVSVDAGGIRT